MSATLTYTSTFVSLDDFGPFPAMVEDGQRWNGFAKPWFTYEAMCAIANAMTTDEWLESDVRIEWTPMNTFVEHGNGEVVPLTHREINGTRYFTMHGWTWMEDTNG